MDVRALAADQADVVAGGQLRGLGWSTKAVERRLERRWRVVPPGVYALTQSPLTRHQLWMAATLSAPGTALAAASAGACWGFRPWEGGFEVGVREGSGGARARGGAGRQRRAEAHGRAAGDADARHGEHSVRRDPHHHARALADRPGRTPRRP